MGSHKWAILEISENVYTPCKINNANLTAQICFITAVVTCMLLEPERNLHQIHEPCFFL